MLSDLKCLHFHHPPLVAIASVPEDFIDIVLFLYFFLDIRLFCQRKGWTLIWKCKIDLIMWKFGRTCIYFNSCVPFWVTTITHKCFPSSWYTPTSQPTTFYLLTVTSPRSYHCTTLYDYVCRLRNSKNSQLPCSDQKKRSRVKRVDHYVITLGISHYALLYPMHRHEALRKRVHTHKAQ